MIKEKNTTIWEKILIMISFFLLFKQLNVFFPSLYIMLALIMGCFLVFIYGKVYLRAGYLWLIPYLSVLSFNYFFGDDYFDSIGDVIQEVAILYFTSAMFIYAVHGNRIIFAKGLVLFTVVTIIYYSISSYLLELVNPGIIRNTVYMINLGELDDLNFFYKSGLVNYQLPHALPILIPPLIMLVREKSLRSVIRVISFLSLLAIFVIVYISYAATPLFLSVVVLILSLLIRKESTKNEIVKMVLIGIVSIPIILNANFILNPLAELFGTVDETSYLDKLLDIENLTKSGEATGSVAAREAKYTITFQEIIEHPLFGTDNKTGNHSAIFDRLASLGLIGWIPYICFLYFQIKTTVRKIGKKKLTYYYVGLIAALFMLFTKNMSNWEMWFLTLTILPLMVWLPTKEYFQQTNN